MKNFIPPWVRVPVIFFTILGFLEWTVDSDKLSFIEKPELSLFLLLVLIVLIGFEVLISAINKILHSSSLGENKHTTPHKESTIPESYNWLKKIWVTLLGKTTKSEEEIIIDHDYDGIRELDNDLPPWWIYGFYISVLFAIIYLFRFEVFGGYTQADELNAEYEDARIAIKAYKKTAKDLIDFDSVELLTGASDIEDGKKIFNLNCVACHKTDGGGGIGPNLTDDYWILGGGIKNVFHTISEGGRDGKGMIAWKQSLSPSDIAKVSSYVINFKGTTPQNPKSPEGEIWTKN